MSETMHDSSALYDIYLDWQRQEEEENLVERWEYSDDEDMYQYSDLTFIEGAEKLC